MDETFIEPEILNGARPEPPAGLTIMPHQVVPPPNHGPPSEDSNTADTVSNAGDIAEPDPTAVAHVPGDWIDIDLWDAEQHSHLSSAPAVNALIAAEYPSMGADIAVAHVTDKIHYTRAAAIADHPGYAASDTKELKAMEEHEVWDTIPITSLSNQERIVRGSS